MQTAVEWLIEQLNVNNYISENAHWLIDDAKKMEREQIVDANNAGYNTRKLKINQNASDYYNETFKTK